MKDDYYCFQLVGNQTSIKRMVAYLYLIKARSQEQTIRVNIWGSPMAFRLAHGFTDNEGLEPLFQGIMPRPHRAISTQVPPNSQTPRLSPFLNQIPSTWAIIFKFTSCNESASLRVQVCICDDLPHIVEPFNEDQKKDPYSELLEADLSLSVSYGRTLTVSASESTNHYASKCEITPDYEVVIPPETVWTAGATVTVDFKVRLLKANDNASVQISIMSQDDTGNDIPLSVRPRIHLTWQPNNVAGVTKLREAWEENDDGSTSPQRRSWATRQGPQPFTSTYGNHGHKSVTMPRHQQPAYSKVETVVKKKMTKMQQIEAQLRQEEDSRRWQEERRKNLELRQPTHSATSSQSSDKKWSGSSVSSYQDSDWNVVRDPRATQQPPNMYNYTEPEPEPQPDNLPSWAQGLGDDFNYDDVVVV